MSTVFQRFLERRQEVKEMLDYFSTEIYDCMLALCEANSGIDPITQKELLQVERLVLSDGSLHVVLQTSNNRSLSFYLLSNGEARIVSMLGTDILADDYVDLTRLANGETMITNEQSEVALSAYITEWAENAFEE